MRGKKGAGLLPENTFSALVAVVAIALLAIGIIYGIYNLYTTNEEKIAKNTINTIADKIDAFNKNPVPFKVNLQGPKGMILYGWGKDNPNRPENCFLKSCVCLCSEKCSINSPCACEGGICRSVDVDDVSVRMPEFYGEQDDSWAGTILSAFLINKIVSNCKFDFGIRFSNNLVEIQIDDKALMRSLPTPSSRQSISADDAKKRVECDKIVKAYAEASAKEKGEKNFVSLYSTSYIPIQ